MFKKLKQGIKNKAMKMMLKKQMANVTPEQEEIIMRMVDEHPELFENISKEIKEKVDAGGNEMYASMQIMQKYQGQLQKILGGTGGGSNMSLG